MNHYRSNVRDIEFNLFEVLGIGRTLDSGAYGELDEITARTILSMVSKLAEGPVAESFVAADRNPVTFDKDSHEVVVPDALKKTVDAVRDAGWSRLGLPEGLGGYPAPSALTWAVREMITAANSNAMFFDLGPMMASSLYEVGNEQQKFWAKEGLEKGWAGTMVLTESDAGSDVGAARTRAIAQPDGTWHIEGVKQFISGGDVGDTAENVFHLVLARPEGAGPGTKGLSLFYVPKYHFDPQTLQLGERNGAFVTGVEHKMGLKSSPTCEVSFGATDTPAVGWLVGDVHDGIAQMFKVIENARMMVGTKAAGTLSTGYLNALEYAKERIQGADLTRAADKTAPRVTIINHPDVRRSLLTQKAWAEGLRALYLYTAAHQNSDVAAVVSGADPDTAARVNDFLLPVVKGVGSERAYQTLTLSLQTFGGSGYLQDHPVEQYIRDTMIDTLYEGTTPIQAQDLFFRKIVRDRGVALGHIVKQIRSFLASRDSSSVLASEGALLETALGDVEYMVKTMVTYLQSSAQDPQELYKVGLGAVELLNSLGELLIGWRLLEQAAVASEAIDRCVTENDKVFYEGKVAVASFFAKSVLPRLSSSVAILRDLDGSVMNLSEAAF